jgi:hypothetical protein
MSLTLFGEVRSADIDGGAEDKHTLVEKGATIPVS